MALCARLALPRFHVERRMQQLPKMGGLGVAKEGL